MKIYDHTTIAKALEDNATEVYNGNLYLLCSDKLYLSAAATNMLVIKVLSFSNKTFKGEYRTLMECVNITKIRTSYFNYSCPRTYIMLNKEEADQYVNIRHDKHTDTNG